MKLKLLLAGTLMLAILVFSVAAGSRTSNEADYFNKRAMLIIRDIGHKVLLHAGDSSSRVLPVRQVNDGVFLLEFESSFSFMPDSLVSIIRTRLGASDLPHTYMVNVLDCTSKQIVYGFEIGPKQKSIVSCNGRVQPKNCYSIEIAFADFDNAGTVSSPFYIYILTALGLSVIAFIGGSYLRKEKKTYTPENDHFIAVGKYSFYADSRVLKSGSETIALSDKESRVLQLLADQQNQLITRDELLKKVWEDDGVFTGRSLDMFISKLRKKLSSDPSLQIVNVHGKGYKLEIRN